MACNCGSKSKPKAWVVIPPSSSGESSKTYSSEMDARLAASRLPGSTVRPA